MVGGSLAERHNAHQVLFEHLHGHAVPQVVRLELGRAEVTAVCFAESPDVLAEERSGSHRFFRSSASGFTTSIGLPAAHASSRSTPPA